MSPHLSLYDVILVNTSGGKDSQVALDEVVRRCDAEGVPRSRIVAVHADLGRVEWPGVAELAQEQAEHYGLRFIKVARPQGDLLVQIEARGMFPSSTTRYCTSDQKRGQVRKVMTMLAAEHRAAGGGRCYILNVMGFRAEESPARRKRVPFQPEGPASNGRRRVDEWLPIHAWSEDEVWARIRDSGVRHHWAYDEGMPRLSCCFCVLASKPALVRAAQLMPELAQTYVELEARIGHRFTDKTSMADIVAEAAATDVVAIPNWNA